MKALLFGGHVFLLHFECLELVLLNSLLLGSTKCFEIALVKRSPHLQRVFGGLFALFFGYKASPGAVESVLLGLLLFLYVLISGFLACHFFSLLSILAILDDS